MMNHNDLDVARKRCGEIRILDKMDEKSNCSENNSDSEQDVQHNEDGFHPEDFTGGILFNSDYSNLDFSKYETTDNDPVRFQSPL